MSRIACATAELLVLVMVGDVHRKSTDLLASSDDVGSTWFVIETQLSDERTAVADCYLVIQQRNDIAKLQDHHQVRARLYSYLFD